MKNIFVALLAVSLTTGFGGCMKDPEPATCEYDPCALKAPPAEVTALKDWIMANNIQATEHCSGLFYRIENAGAGNTPKACSDVQANYKGSFKDGTVFEQSQQPIDFNLSGVIEGWTKGVPLVKEGGRIVLYIPPSLAYGPQDRRDAQGIVRIPGNSTLIFEVDLVRVFN